VPVPVLTTGTYTDGTPRWVLLRLQADVPAAHPWFRNMMMEDKRGIGNLLMTHVYAYQLTGDGRYYDAAVKMIDSVREPFEGLGANLFVKAAGRFLDMKIRKRRNSMRPRTTPIASGISPGARRSWSTLRAGGRASIGPPRRLPCASPTRARSSVRFICGGRSLVRRRFYPM